MVRTAVPDPESREPLARPATWTPLAGAVVAVLGRPLVALATGQ